MMTRLRLVMLLLAAALAPSLCQAQGGNTITLTGSGAPTGSCAFMMWWVRTSNGDTYNCGPGGVWQLAFTGGGGGGGTPGGANTQVQFNDSGAFGGDAGLTYVKATDALTLAGTLSLPLTTSATAGPIFVDAKRFLWTAAAADVFLGSEAGTLTNTGVRNTAVGNFALGALTDGINNTAIGNAAMNRATSADNNTAIGRLAMDHVTTAQDNIAIGSGALETCNTCAQNIAIGNFSVDTQTGTSNVGVGDHSLAQTAGSNNTALGQDSCYTVGSGSNNTCLGYTADVNLGTRTNATAIGNGAVVSADNAVQLGNTSVTLVNTSGTITAPKYASTTNCSDSAGAAACGAAPAGSVVIDAGATTVVVSTTAVTANSQIFVQEDSGLGARLGITCNGTPQLNTVSARTGGTSFTITTAVTPAVNARCYSYFIVN